MADDGWFTGRIKRDELVEGIFDREYDEERIDRQLNRRLIVLRIKNRHERLWQLRIGDFGHLVYCVAEDAVVREERLGKAQTLPADGCERRQT